jgi:membrane protease YdiL (CAAX protease family)
MVIVASIFAIWGIHPLLFFPGRRFNPPLTWQWALWKGVVFAPAVLIIAWRALDTGWTDSVLRIHDRWRWIGPIPQIILPVVGFTLIPFGILNGGVGLLAHPALPLSWPMVLAGVVTSTWSAAIPEEVFFRLVLQSRLEATSGALVAVLVSGVLFGAIHLPEFVWMSHLDPIQAAEQVGLYEVLPGFLYGYMWYRYRNIYANIAAHAAFDIAFVLSLLAGGLR